MTISFTRSLFRNFAFALGVGVLLVLSAGVVGRLAPHAFAMYPSPECTTNAVVYCGFTSKSDFISKVQNGDGKGHKDLAALYAVFGFTSGDYSRFINDAKLGTVYKDGRVVVDGRTVATDAFSYGRLSKYHTGPNMRTISAGGTTFYGNYSTTSFAGVSNFTAYVLFDSTGTPEFIVLDACGNPISATIVKSSVACNLLNATPVAGKQNTYDFTASATPSGFAGVTKYVYDFGDGSSQVTKSNGTDVVSHQYTKVGNFTAKVTVYATSPWGGEMSSTTSSCQKPITVVQPYYQCVQLGGALLDKDKYSYRFTTDMKYGNGAKFVSADFDFGDGKTATGVTSTDGKTVSTDHMYAKAGNYSVAAVLRFSVDGATVTASTCRAMVTPTAPPVPECKPGIPVGDIRCTPCQYDTSLPADDVRCVAPVTSLPNTGAGNVIALGTTALIGGFLWYRHLLFRRHKRAYLAAEIGASPLPLGNPLESDSPLAGTPVQPVAPKRRSLRRRQF